MCQDWVAKGEANFDADGESWAVVGRCPGEGERTRCPSEATLEAAVDTVAGSSSSATSSSSSEASEEEAEAVVAVEAVEQDCLATRPGDFRRRFLEKLACNNVLVSQRPPRYQTVTIFDYDDTLVGTSYMNRLGDQFLSEADQQLLRRTARRARAMLEMAAAHGQVYIVTNATASWVAYSAELWAPQLIPVLEEVHIVSARDQFEAAYPGDVAQWKIQAFLELSRSLDPGLVTNLIVIGDAEFEMDAAKAMSKKFDEVVLKTIKLQPQPSLSELSKEVELVAGKFQSIVNTSKCMKVHLQRKGQ